MKNSYKILLSSVSLSLLLFQGCDDTTTSLETDYSSAEILNSSQISQSSSIQFSSSEVSSQLDISSIAQSSSEISSESISTPSSSIQFSSESISSSSQTINEPSSSSDPVSSSEQVSSSEEVSTNARGVFTDLRDDQQYGWVEIGNQIWMAKNLNYETTTGSVCYDNDPSNCEAKGRLYDWNTAMDNSTSSDSVPSGIQGVCPSGWHVPSNTEWLILDSALGNELIRGAELKSTTGWGGSSYNGNDTYGFNALPSGFYEPANSYFNDILTEIEWWSASQNTPEYTFITNVSSFDSYFFVNSKSVKTRYLSVRCLQDESL